MEKVQFLMILHIFEAHITNFKNYIQQKNPFFMWCWIKNWFLDILNRFGIIKLALNDRNVHKKLKKLQYYVFGVNAYLSTFPTSPTSCGMIGISGLQWSLPIRKSSLEPNSHRWESKFPVALCEPHTGRKWVWLFHTHHFQVKLAYIQKSNKLLFLKSTISCATKNVIYVQNL